MPLQKNVSISHEASNPTLTQMLGLFYSALSDPNITHRLEIIFKQLSHAGTEGFAYIISFNVLIPCQVLQSISVFLQIKMRRPEEIKLLA